MHNSPFCRELCILLVCFFVSLSSFSQVSRYVSPSGDDTGPNDCSVSGSPCQTIAHAISQSSANDIVILAAGTYSESVNINADITLRGANTGIAASGTRGAESIINPVSNAVAISVSSSGVSIDGVQIGASNVSSNVTTGVSNSGNSDLVIENSIVYANSAGVSVSSIASGSITINDNSIEMPDLEDATNATNGSVGIFLSALTGSVDADILNNDLSGASWGILGYNLESSSTLVIDGGNYTGCTKGIEIDNADGLGGFAPSTVIVQNVTMSGFTGPDVDVAQPDAQAGIYSFVGSATSADDVDLTIDNVDISGVGNAASDYSGIYLGGFASSASASDLLVAVTNSNVHDNLNRGLYARGETTVASISESVFDGNGFDPRVVGGNPGFSIIARVSAVVSVNNCTIVNAAAGDQAPASSTAGLASDGASLTVMDCSISNNGNGSLATGLGGTLDLSRNWFGSTDQTTIEGFISTPSQVDFTPAISSGIDTDGVTEGFQPDLSGLQVLATAGIQTGSTGRWQEGHDLVDPGGTVVLTNADYAETVTVSKNVTFQPTTSGSDTSLDDLIMNGSGITLTLSGNLVIDNAITLTQGNINVASGELRLGSSASNFVETASSTVSGMVTMDPRAVGTGSFDLLGVSITGAEDLGNVTIARTTGSSGITVDGPNSSIAVLWDITSDNPPAGNRDVTFNWRSDFDNGKDMTNIAVFRNGGSGWEDVTGGTSDVSSTDPRSLTVNGVVAFSSWTMAEGAAPLPVELISFDATHFESHNELTWATMVEINSDRFEVEKSSDGSSFLKVGTVRASGNTNHLVNYEWKDDSPVLNGGRHAYYRLKIVDLDGSFEYSKVALVENEMAADLRVFPNPVSEFLNVEVGQSNFNYQVFDEAGRMVKSETDSRGRINTSTLNKGIYFLRVDGYLPAKFIVDK